MPGRHLYPETTKMAQRILYVDDDQINLFNFKQSFSDEFTIFTAASGEEALALLEREEEMAVVVADQRMPGMNGIDLLTRVGDRCPDTVRIVLTAYTEIDDLLDSINKGQVYKYIVKPWEEKDLRIALTNAVARYTLTRQNRQLIDQLKAERKDLERLNLRLEELVAERTRELERSNDELAARLRDLEESRTMVNKLQNILPICAYCKKIRDDKQYWTELVSFLQRHSDLQFTHSICPSCYESVVKPGLSQFIEENKKNSPCKDKQK